MSKNLKNLTLFPSAQDAGHLSELLPPLVPEKDKRRDKLAKQATKHLSPPPRLPLKARHATTPRSEDAALTTSFYKKESPWKIYQSILHDNEAGAATIAFVRDPGCEVVAIKERNAVSDKELDSLQRVQHDNVVLFLAAFQDDDHLYLVYESIYISLQEIQCGPMGPWREYELAAICEQVSLYQIFVHEC